MGPGETPLSGTIADLIHHIPHLLVGGFIPPLAVTNDVLRNGVCDAGMSGGCRWSPFTLSSLEYSELAESLARDGDLAGKKLEPIDVPPWVTTRAEWDVWVAYLRYSIPWKENLRFTRKLASLDREMEQAAQKKDEPKRLGCLLEVTAISSQHSDFVLKHRKSRP